MVGVRGIPIFGDRSRKFCFFFQWTNNRLPGEASDVAVDATNHLREILELIERVIEDRAVQISEERASSTG